jgi:hypothetical protein
MRKILTLIAMMALAGCGGGGGANTSPNPNPQPPAPTTAPTSGYVTPQFIIRIPARQGAANGRTPKYVSSATLSVQITLTADSVGIDPTTITGNPATTNVTAGSCSSGCTVNGPPTPPGTDSFKIVTFDANGATGHALNAAQANNVTIAAGQNTAVPVTLGAIPATLSISNVPTGAGAFPAGTQSQTTAISVVAADGHGDTIPTSQSPAVFYVDSTGTALNITVTDPDTNAHGSCVVNTGTSTCTGAAPTSVTFSGPDVTRMLAYDGLAENPVTLTASASGATNGTASFQPKLNAPAFNSSQATPAGVALTASAEIDLFATSGVGSTGTESFTESGWTNTPYNHALLVTGTPACTPAAPALSGIATVTVGANSTTNGTPFTATAVGSPTAGSCPVTVGDGLSSNTTDGSATLTVTYTTSSVSASSKRRR